ncbi:MAG TPA: GNAT family N-acetyltransferase [Anaerolineales bacterium]|nr:GNAT family N-acetyltransferase [Anaerolineales bacterium]
MDIQFTKITEPSAEIAELFNKWGNDPSLVHLIRPNTDAAALEQKEHITVDSLKKRLEHDHIYLIQLEGELIGEMNFQIDPPQVYKKETGTAWIGVNIGEEVGRGKGIGFTAIQFLEEQARAMGLKRVELGVFEFNLPAIKLYTNLGYKEIVRIDNFTYWDGKMWQDIRMEKYL